MDFVPRSASNAWPHLTPRYVGYVAWRALIPEAAVSSGDPPRAVQFHDLLPAAGRAVSGLSGRRSPTMICVPAIARYNVVWYRPADERAELTRC
jgi:hypothetical protein